MVRTQIQLTDQQARRVRAQARERGLSLAEMIRRYVEKGLSEESPDRATLSTSFVLVETYELVGRRLGLDAARSFRADFAPLIDVVWVDEALHNAGLDLLLDRRRRPLSLVDAVSFITMRQTNVAEAFAFDPHFEQEGFSVVG